MSLPALTKASVPEARDDLPVIEVKNLVKEYRLGAFEGLRSMAKRLLGRNSAEQRQQFRALDDVSFSVKRGEVVGIIGHNGAGKSTLLKHLCRITTPTSGTVTVRGRVAPLIEVGAGLVGEMTGRENIYLNASILGLSRQEIESKIDEIIAFAELERFIDTPIKRYSSGMQVRLGFAIATAVNSEVLIVDEVLAVGDLAFQRKCFDRMTALLSGKDKTVLIVGHNIRQIQRLASRMILMSNGQVIADGAPESVSAKFYGQMDAAVDVSRLKSRLFNIETTGEILIQSVSLLGPDGRATTTVPMDQDATFEIEFAVETAVSGIEVALGIHTADQVYVATESSGRERLMDFVPGKYRLRCTYQDLKILPGEYAVRIFFQDSLGTNIVNGEDVCRFHVAAGKRNRANLSAVSLVSMPSSWELASA